MTQNAAADRRREAFCGWGFRIPASIALTVVALAAAGPVAVTAASTSDSEETQAPTADVLSSYTMGIFLFENGSYRAAIPHLETAWRASEDDAMIGEKLATAYYQIGDFDGCERVLDEVLAKHDDRWMALLLKARILDGRQQPEEAVALLEHAREVGEPSFDVEQLLGKLYFQLGRDDDALEAYGRAVQIDRSRPFLHYKYGLLLKQYDRQEEAEEAFRSALSLEPALFEAALELADIYTAEGRFDEAEKVLLESQARVGGNYDIAITLSNLYLETGRLDDAIRVLEEQGTGGTLPREGVVLLGRLYYEAKDYEEAIGIFEGLFENEQNNPEIARVLGEISIRAGRPDKARTYYELAIANGPDDYRNYMALFFAASPDFATDDIPVIDLPPSHLAALLSSASEKVDANDFEGSYLIGMSYQSIDSLDRAREHLVHANELRPNERRVLLNLAGVLEKMEAYGEAETYLATLHEANPKDATVCNFYGYLLALMDKNLEKAEGLIRTALEQEPGNGYYVDSLGWVYYMRGDFDRAVIELEKAVAIVGDDPIILEHLGDAYRSLEQYERALAAYEKSLGLQDNTELRGKIDAARRLLSD